VPVWIQDLENTKITTGVCGNNEIMLIENNNDIWSLSWDEQINDVRL